MMDHRKSLFYTAIATAGIFLLLCAGAVRVRTGNSGVLMTITADTEIKTSADGGSQTVVSLPAGSAVFVTGNAGDGWYTVFYQGLTCYIRADRVAYLVMEGNPSAESILGANYQKAVSITAESTEAEEPVAEENDSEEEIVIEEAIEAISTGEERASIEFDEDFQAVLEAEFEDAANRFDDQAAELERYEKERRSAFLWKTILIAVVIATFVVGFLSYLGGNTAGRIGKETDPEQEEIADLDKDTSLDVNDEADHSDSVL